MNESSSFPAQLRERRSALQAWGAYIVERVPQLLRAEIGEERLSTFFKVAPGSRVKDEVSALRKQAKKQYATPVEEMTDLVGARFVVLLRTDLEQLERVVLAHPGWTASRERHFEYEANTDPGTFDYQSIHFLLRVVGDLDRGGVVIPDGTTCEVQLRTILQHAYAELCHDRIYKASSKIPTTAKRAVARCMALMETTDLMFCDAVREIEQASGKRDEWIAFLSQEYARITKDEAPRAEESTCALIVETYLHLLDGVKTSDVAASAQHVAIQARLGDGLFASPGCLLCYWLVREHQFETLRLWPDERLRSDLQRIGNDLGYSM